MSKSDTNTPANGQNPAEAAKVSAAVDKAPYMSAKTDAEPAGKSHLLAFSISAIALIGVIVYLGSQFFQQEFQQGMATINKSINDTQIISTVDNTVSSVVNDIVTGYDEFIATFVSENSDVSDTETLVQKIEATEVEEVMLSESTSDTDDASGNTTAMVHDDEPAQTDTTLSASINETVHSSDSSSTATTDVVVKIEQDGVTNTATAAELQTPAAALPVVKALQPASTPYHFMPYGPYRGMPYPAGNIQPYAYQPPAYQAVQPQQYHNQRQAFDAMMERRREAFNSAMRQREESIKQMNILRSAVYRDIEKNREQASQRMQELRMKMQKIREQSITDMQQHLRAMAPRPFQG